MRPKPPTLEMRRLVPIVRATCRQTILDGIALRGLSQDIAYWEKTGDRPRVIHHASGPVLSAMIDAGDFNAVLLYPIDGDIGSEDQFAPSIDAPGTSLMGEVPERCTVVIDGFHIKRERSTNFRSWCSLGETIRIRIWLQPYRHSKTSWTALAPAPEGDPFIVSIRQA
jgi:hypothetical protein